MERHRTPEDGADDPDRHNELSQQEKEGVGYLWLQLLGIFAVLLIFLVIAMLVL